MVLTHDKASKLSVLSYAEEIKNSMATSEKKSSFYAKCIRCDEIARHEVWRTSDGGGIYKEVAVCGKCDSGYYDFKYPDIAAVCRKCGTLELHSIRSRLQGDSMIVCGTCGETRFVTNDYIDDSKELTGEVSRIVNAGAADMDKSALTPEKEKETNMATKEKATNMSTKEKTVKQIANGMRRTALRNKTAEVMLRIEESLDNEHASSFLRSDIGRVLVPAMLYKAGEIATEGKEDSKIGKLNKLCSAGSEEYIQQAVTLFFPDLGDVTEIAALVFADLLDSNLLDD